MPPESDETLTIALFTPFCNTIFPLCAICPLVLIILKKAETEDLLSIIIQAFSFTGLGAIITAVLLSALKINFETGEYDILPSLSIDFTL